MILSIVQKFMRAVNARREDFEFNNWNEEAKEESDEELKEAHYNSSKPKDQTPVKNSPEKSQPVSMSSPLALKNNYMSPKEAVEDERVELTHPLKSQLIGCFSEMASSKAKYQIIRPLSYCTSILKDSSVNDKEWPLYLSPSELDWIIKVLWKLVKINEIDAEQIIEVFEWLKSIGVSETLENADFSTSYKTKILLSEVVEHIVDVEGIGHSELVTSFYEVLNSYAEEFKKSKMCELVAQVDYHRKTLDKVSFRVHLDYLIDQILGEVFFFEDIEPIIPLLVACLEDNEDETQEDEALKQQAMGMFFKLFGMHDSKEIANKIEKLLLNENKLYPIFFKKIKTKLMQEENQRPKTTNPDFYSVPWSNEKNYQEDKKDSEDEDDDFPLNNNYKLIESRPKTSCGLMINTKEDDEDAYRKDINFDLSPSQTDANEQECKILL